MPQSATPPIEAPPSYPAIKLDWEDWLPMIEDPSLSDADKRQLIETLHTILVVFVDLRWEIATPEDTSGQVLDLTQALRASVLRLDEAQESEVV